MSKIIADLRAEPSSSFPALPGASTPDSVLISNSFLRQTNQILLSLLTPAQKIEFLSILVKDSPFIAPEVALEFDRIRERLVASVAAEREARLKREAASGKGGRGLNVDVNFGLNTSILRSPVGSPCGSGGSRTASPSRKARSPAKGFLTSQADKEN